MKLINFKKEIVKLGAVGIVESEREILCTINAYDVAAHVQDDEIHFFTTRKTSKRGEYDAGSDYNPGGYIFHTKLKDLRYWTTDRV